MAHTFQVLFGDSARPADDVFYNRMTSVEVEENADLPGAIQLTIPLAAQGAAGAEDLTIVGDERFQPYARLAVVVSPEGGTDACIFDGYVLSHRVHHDCGTTESSAQIWGQDVSCLMNLEDKTREWTDADGAIANAIFNDYQIKPSDDNTSDDSGDHKEDPSTVSAHTVMQRGTDAQFLRDRARRSGRLFRVCCDRRAGANTGYFARPKVAGEAAITIVINPPAAANVDALDFHWDVARPTDVAAKALVATKDPVDGGATQSGLGLLDSRSLAAFAGTNRVMTTRLTAAVDSAGELRTRAESLLRESNWFVRCEGEGDLSKLKAVMRVGTLVQVNGAGRLHSGKYLVWSVRHAITAQSHRMRFVLVRNAVGAA